MRSIEGILGLVVAALSLAIGARQGLPWSYAAPWAVFIGFLATNAAFDARTMLLKRSYTLIALLVFLISVSVARGDDRIGRLGYSLLFALSVTAILGLIAHFRPQALGLGDAWLAGVLCAWWGYWDPSNLLDFFASTCCIQTALILALLTVRVLMRSPPSLHQALPFGPALVGAGWLVQFA